MRKKRAVSAAVVAAVCLALAGCGLMGGSGTGSWDAGSNSIYVNRDMEVESAIVYTAPQANELYRPEELAAFAEEAVSAYNQARGAAAKARNGEGEAKLPAALKSSSLEGSTGKLVFEYGTPGDFVSFSQETGDNTHSVTALEVGKVSDLAAQGKLSGMSFVRPDGKEASSEEAARAKNGVAMLVEGAGTFYTQGKLAFISKGAGEITVKDEHTVVTGEGSYCIVFQ